MKTTQKNFVFVFFDFATTFLVKIVFFPLGDAMNSKLMFSVSLSIMLKLKFLNKTTELGIQNLHCAYFEVLRLQLELSRAI